MSAGVTCKMATLTKYDLLWANVVFPRKNLIYKKWLTTKIWHMAQHINLNKVSNTFNIFFDVLSE
jgi:hypothetical protein